MNEYLITPYFLDEERPALLEAFPNSWHVNQPFLRKGPQTQRMSTLHRPIAEFVAAEVGRGNRPISVAGDCCTTIGVLAGLQFAGIDPTLLWLDAHGDFNTVETSPSGFLGGMPLAMIVGRGDQTLTGNVALTRLPEAQVVLSDARDLDPGELNSLKKSAVRHLVQFSDLLSWDWGDRPLYVHFDTDVINPQVMPAASYPAAGGPSPDDLKRLFRDLHARANVVAVSMAAWNTEKDVDGNSAELVRDLLNTLAGR